MTELMGSPRDRKYTRTHEWVSLDGDVATIGVTDFAQAELGDITYLELPEIGDPIALDQAFGIVESVKAANEFSRPLMARWWLGMTALWIAPKPSTNRLTMKPGWCASKSPTRASSISCSAKANTTHSPNRRHTNG